MALNNNHNRARSTVGGGYIHVSPHQSITRFVNQLSDEPKVSVALHFGPAEEFYQTLESQTQQLQLRHPLRSSGARRELTAAALSVRPPNKNRFAMTAASREGASPRSKHTKSFESKENETRAVLFSTEMERPMESNVKEEQPPLSVGVSRRKELYSTHRIREKLESFRKNRLLDSSIDDAGHSTQESTQPFTKSRQHLEVQACMLAYQHSLDVQGLHELREFIRKDRLEQQTLSAGKSNRPDAQELSKNKTQFLLSHFFNLNHAPSMGGEVFDAPSMEILDNVIEDWALDEQATPIESANLWKDISEHMEESYLISDKLKHHDLPNQYSTAIALDILQTLGDKLPQYQKILSVVHRILSEAIYVPRTEPNEQATDQVHHKLTALGASRRTYHVELNAAHERNQKILLEMEEWRQYNASSIQERVLNQFEQVTTIQDKKMLVSNMLTQISDHVDEDFMNKLLEQTTPQVREHISYGLVSTLSTHDAKRVLDAINQSKNRGEYLREYFYDRENLFQDILFGEGSDLGDVLVKKNIAKISDILMHSSSASYALIEACPALLTKMMEQHAEQTSLILASNLKLFQSLLILSYNNQPKIMHEFLSTNQSCLRQLFTLQPGVLESVLVSSGKLLREMLSRCSDYIRLQFLDHPDLLVNILRHSNQDVLVLAKLFEQDSDLLTTSLSLCPESLSKALEKHRTLLLDITYRSPGVLTTLFNQNPEILLEPMLANPGLLIGLMQDNQKLMDETTLLALGLEKIKTSAYYLMASSTQTVSSALAHDTTNYMRSKIQTDLLYTFDLIHEIVMKNKKIVSMSLQDMNSTILRIYVEKVSTDQYYSEIGVDCDSFHATVWNHFQLNEKRSREKGYEQLYSFLSAVKKYDKDHPRAYWFGILLGITAPIESTDLKTKIFFRAFHDLSEAVENATEAPVEDAKQWTVELSHATQVASKLLESECPSNYIVVMCERMKKMKRSYEMKKRSYRVVSEVVHVEDVLYEILKTLVDYEVSVDSELMTIFGQEQDAHGDIILNVEDFTKILEKNNKSYDAPTVLGMFRLCGQLYAQGEFELRPAEMITSMKSYKKRYCRRESVL